ncbi:hypothetical protein WJX81_003517 [Elliptochloris bilobata]|uniref:Uncharacterized protein n=1 Tax=Elliptochloris bilobata TaxID=381761 RepID=A0AAW1S3B4_9CHLO
MRPPDFAGLTAALQANLAGRVCIWLAAVHPAWQEVDMTAPDAMQQAAACMDAANSAALEDARSHNFPAKLLPSGRCDNLVLLSHSSATLFAAPLAARRAGALALLGSYIFPSAQAYASLSEWSRPVLHLGGDLDGQARFPKLAVPALDSAAAAYKLGPRHAAAHKPVVLLHGVNHAQLSNGALREGDLEPELDAARATRAAATVLGDFVAAHASPDSACREVRREAVDRLLEHCISTAAWLSPFTAALGRGSPAQLWQHAMQAGPAGAPCDAAEARGTADAPMASPHGVALALLPGGVLAGAYGAEVLPDEEASRRFHAHPGELAAAERFTIAVQRRLAAAACGQGGSADWPASSAAPAAALRVAVSVHTDEAMFIYSQPALVEEDGCLLVHAHCYLHRPSLVPFGHRIPVAPHYLLKLKSCDAIRLAYGLDHAEDSEENSSLAASVNRETYDAALSLVATAARERHERRGRRLHFAPDRRALWAGM